MSSHNEGSQYLSMTVACAWCDGPCETEDDDKIHMFTIPEMEHMDRLPFCTIEHGEMFFCQEAAIRRLEVTVEVASMSNDSPFWCPIVVTGVITQYEELGLYHIDQGSSHIIFPSRCLIGHRYDEIQKRHILTVGLSDLYHAYEV